MALTSLPYGEAYESIMGRWSNLLALAFLRWVSVPVRSRWLDVGCGTGALTRAILDSQQPTAVAGVDPDVGYIEHARGRFTDDRTQFFQADAQKLPLQLGGFDAAVSGLALNLCPDPALVLSEMIRVTRPGGKVAVYVWDFAGGMQMIRYLWDAAAELDPASCALDQGNCFPICNPDRLREEMGRSGLADVQVQPLTVDTTFQSFDDYWEPLLSGHGRVGGYVMSITESLRAALRERLESILPRATDGSIPLQATAWAARGTVNRQ